MALPAYPEIDPLTGKFKQTGAALDAALNPADPNGATTMGMSAATAPKVPINVAESLAGNWIGPRDPKFGANPYVPNPDVTQKRAFEGNLANFDDLTNLTTKTNDLLAGEYTSRLPGYNDLAQKNSSNIADQLAGKLPQDVINMLGTSAAERGVGGGISGSQFTNSDYLRSLGLTSLGEKEKGGKAYDQALGRIHDIPTFDPTSMFTTPTDQYNAQLSQNIFAAAPDPTAAGRANEVSAMSPFLRADAERRTALANTSRDNERLLATTRGSMVGMY